MSKRLQGLNAWILQRASAVYIAAFTIYFLVVMLVAPPTNYLEWKAWVTAPVVGLGWMLLFVLLLGHAWVGMRDVFMDYISSITIRSIALGVLALGLLACGLWVSRIMVLAFV